MPLKATNGRQQYAVSLRSHVDPFNPSAESCWFVCDCGPAKTPIASFIISVLLPLFFRGQIDQAIAQSEGAVVMVGGSSVDITERRQAGEALRESEDRYQDLVEHSHDMVYTHDLEGRVLFANQTSSQLLGLAPSEVVGRRLTEFLVPEVRDQFDAYLAEISKNGLASGLMLVQTSTGERRVCEYRNTLRAESTSGPIVRCIARDVTERRRAEEALQESEERFRQLSEAAFEAIILHDQGTILEVNQSFCRMYGYERAEVIGKSVLDLALPEFRELLLQKVRSGDTGPYEGPALRKDGTIFKAEVAGKPINYQGRVVRVGAIRDITEQKRNERRQAAQYAVTRVLAESATLAEAIPQLLQVICESLRWKMGEFWRAWDSTNLLRCVETWHVPALDATAFIEASRQTELAPGVGLPGRVWQSGQPAWIPDVMTDPRFARAAIAAKVGLRGAVAFPILLGNHTLGVMLFFSRRTPEVDEELLKVMSAVGSQIGQFTERKRGEEALRQAEEKYRTIFENAGEGIFQTTPEGRIITANPALARMHGFDSPEELVRERTDIASQHYVDPQRRDEFKRLLEEHGFVRGFEYQGYRKDGRKIWLSDSVRAVRDESGAILYYEGIAEDITERKQAEIRSAAFATLAQKLSGARIPADAARIIVDTAHELLGWDACTLHLYDANQDLVYPVLNIDTINGQRVDLTLSAAAEAPSLRARQVMDLMDQGATLILREEPYEFDAYSVPFGDISRPSASIMCVPMHSASTVVGLLSIQSYTPRAYDDAALNDLQALADYCGEALNRIRAEVSLYESEERFRQIAENLEDVLWMTDREAKNVLYINPAYEAVWGRSCESLYKRLTSFVEAVHSDDRQNVQRMVKMQAGGRHEPFEYRIIKPDGSMRWIRDRSFPIRNNEGEVYRLAGLAEDITERKRAEEALLASERKYRDIFTFAPVGIYQSLRDGTIITANHTLAEMLGYASVNELLKVKLGSGVYLSEDERERLIREHEVRGYPADLELQWKTKDGTPIWIQLSAHAINGANGVTEYREGFVRDITARKEAEQALHQAEQKYRELFENAKDAIYVHDLSGRYTSLNRAAEQLSGYSREEILGKHFSSFVAPEYVEHMHENLCKKLRQEGETTYEGEVITKDGRRVPVEVSSRLIHEEGVPIAVQGTARNIVERKRAEEALRGYSRQLIRAQEVERQSIARELHDQIGQVLTAIRINLETIRDSPNRAASNALIDEGVTIVDEAIQQVRDLSFELRPSLLDDLGLTAALLWYANRFAQRTGIQTKTSICPESRIRLPHELETTCFRIVQEALTNVARHAQAKNVSIDVRTMTGALSLSIKDDGIGFNLHSQTNGELLISLGLRGMEERAHELGGKLQIKSASHEGTEVRVHFPNGSKRKEFT